MKTGLVCWFFLCFAAMLRLLRHLRVLFSQCLLQEEDMLNIQFSMVELQNRCSDQGAASSVFELSAVLESLP